MNDPKLKKELEYRSEVEPAMMKAIDQWIYEAELFGIDRSEFTRAIHKWVTNEIASTGIQDWMRNDPNFKINIEGEIG